MPEYVREPNHYVLQGYGLQVTLALSSFAGPAQRVVEEMLESPRTPPAALAAAGRYSP